MCYVKHCPTMRKHWGCWRLQCCQHGVHGKDLIPLETGAAVTAWVLL